MPEPLSNMTPPRRNRIGCFVIAAVLALFILLYMFAGFSADPGNSAAEDIQAVPH